MAKTLSAIPAFKEHKLVEVFSLVGKAIYLLSADCCTKLESSLALACPILIDFVAEYCPCVIIHLRMMCVSVYY